MEPRTISRQPEALRRLKQVVNDAKQLQQEHQEYATKLQSLIAAAKQLRRQRRTQELPKK